MPKSRTKDLTEYLYKYLSGCVLILVLLVLIDAPGIAFEVLGWLGASGGVGGGAATVGFSGRHWGAKEQSSSVMPIPEDP
jgi:hypothetical protein